MQRVAVVPSHRVRLSHALTRDCGAGMRLLCGSQDSPWMVQKPSRLFVSAVCSSHRQRTPHHEPFGQISGDGQAEQQQPGWWDELIDDLMTDLKFIAPGPDAAPDQLVIHRAFWGRFGGA